MQKRFTLIVILLLFYFFQIGFFKSQRNERILLRQPKKLRIPKRQSDKEIRCDIKKFFRTYDKYIPGHWKEWFALVKKKKLFKKPISVEEFLTSFMNFDRDWKDGERFLQRYDSILDWNTKEFWNKVLEELKLITNFNVAKMLKKNWNIIPLEWKEWYQFEKETLAKDFTIKSFVETQFKYSERWESCELFLKEYGRKKKKKKKQKNKKITKKFELFLNRVLLFMKNRKRIKFKINDFIQEFKGKLDDSELIELKFNDPQTANEFFEKFIKHKNSINDLKRIFYVNYKELNEPWRSFLRIMINKYEYFGGHKFNTRELCINYYKIIRIINLKSLNKKCKKIKENKLPQKKELTAEEIFDFVFKKLKNPLKLELLQFGTKYSSRVETINDEQIKFLFIHLLQLLNDSIEEKDEKIIPEKAKK